MLDGDIRSHFCHVDRVARSIGGARTDESAELMLGVLCGALQGGIPMTYHFDSDLAAAKALDASGVCPGNLGNLVRAVD